MPGGILRLLTDQVVADIPTRNKISIDWNIFNAGQGVVVENASRDFPSIGLGDPTVGTPGSNAYYKWDGTKFVKISEGDEFVKAEVYSGASPSTIALGGIPAGTDLTKRTLSSIIEQAVVVYLQPSFTVFYITGQGVALEVGDSIVAGNKIFTWATSNNGNILPSSIVIRNQSAQADLITGLANNGSANFNLLAPIQLNAPGASQVFRILMENTQNQVVSIDLTITAFYNRFFGSPATAPNDSASIRAMAKTFGNTFSIVIPQGNQVAAFAYEATRPDIVDNNVKYVEGFNANVGSTFVKTLLNVNDAGGTPRSYKLYVATLGAPYQGQATYNVTIP
jgi:hypothetical protein